MRKHKKLLEFCSMTFELHELWPSQDNMFMQHGVQRVVIYVLKEASLPEVSSNLAG